MSEGPKVRLVTQEGDGLEVGTPLSRLGRHRNS